MFRSKKGQALVEFTLSLFIILALLIGVVIMGIVFYSYVTLDKMAREGVTYALENANYLEEASGGSDTVRDRLIISHMKQYAGLLDTNEPYPMRFEITYQPPFYVEVTVFYVIDFLSLKMPNPISGGEITVIQPITLKVTAASTYE